MSGSRKFRQGGPDVYLFFKSSTYFIESHMNLPQEGIGPKEGLEGEGGL